VHKTWENTNTTGFLTLITTVDHAKQSLTRLCLLSWTQIPSKRKYSMTLDLDPIYIRTSMMCQKTSQQSTKCIGISTWKLEKLKLHHFFSSTKLVVGMHTGFFRQWDEMSDIDAKHDVCITVFRQHTKCRTKTIVHNSFNFHCHFYNTYSTLWIV